MKSEKMMYAVYKTYVRLLETDYYSGRCFSDNCAERLITKTLYSGSNKSKAFELFNFEKFMLKNTPARKSGLIVKAFSGEVLELVEIEKENATQIESVESPIWEV